MHKSFLKLDFPIIKTPIHTQYLHARAHVIKNLFRIFSKFQRNNLFSRNRPFKNGAYCSFRLRNSKVITIINMEPLKNTLKTLLKIGTFRQNYHISLKTK